MRNSILFFAFLVVCLACTAQTPGGVDNEVQTKNGTSFGGSNLFTDSSSHTSLYSTVPYTFWGRDSSQTLGSSSFQNLYNCVQDSMFGAGGKGTASCNLYNVLFSAPGLNNGNAPGAGIYNWSVTKVNNIVDNTFTPGIHQVYSINLNAGKTGDDAAFYAYCYDEGGRVDVSGEGHTCLRVNGGNDASRQYGATSKDTGTGLTTLHTNIGSGYLTPGLAIPTFPLVGGYIIDSSITAPDLVSGSVTGYDPNTQLLTVDQFSLTPASAIGTTTAAITLATSNADSGTMASVSLNVTQGSFTDGPMVFGCSDFIDFVDGHVTGTAPSQTITANFWHSHSSNCVVSQGGTQGILDLVADEIGTNWKTSYYVFAVPTISGQTKSNQILVRTYVTGALNAIHDSRHNFGTKIDVTGMLTRSGGIVSACNINLGVLWRFSGQAVKISNAGAFDSGPTPFTASNVDARNCLTWSQSGTDVTTAVNGTIETGGTVGALGQFNIYPAAMVKSVGVTPAPPTTNGRVQNVFDGTFNLFPNSMKVTSGHMILSLFDMSAKTEPLTAYGKFDTPPNNTLNIWHPVTVQGYGVTTENFQMERLFNGNPYSMYKSGGSSGQMDAPRGLTFQGPFVNTIYMDQPMPGGTAIKIRPNPMSQAGLYSTHNVIFDQGGKGSSGLTMNFDPIHGKTVLFSSDGTGMGAAFAFDKTTIDVGATNLIFEQVPTGTCSYALAADSSQKTVRARCVQVVTGSGCNIATPSVGASCTQALSIPNAYTDTNYDVTGCTVTNGSGLSVIGNVVNSTNSIFTVTQVGLTASTTGIGTIKCIVSHP